MKKMKPKRYGEFTARKQSSQFMIQLTKKSNNYKPKEKKKEYFYHKTERGKQDQTRLFYQIYVLGWLKIKLKRKNNMIQILLINRLGVC